MDNKNVLKPAYFKRRYFTASHYHFFEIRETRNGDPFILIDQRTKKGENFESQKIILFRDEIAGFLEVFQDSHQQIRSNAYTSQPVCYQTDNEINTKKTDKNLELLALELIDLKKKINELTEKEKILKEKIKPMLKQCRSIQFSSGEVYYKEKCGAKTFKRSNVLQYIRDRYGDSLADQIDEDCTEHGKTVKTVYVKIINS
jgi:hypothetical protein